MKQIELKINVGCGPSGQIRNFDNIDNSPNILLSKIPFLKKLLFKIGLIAEHQYKSNWSDVIRCDVSKGLPYSDQSVSKIYTSHFLEHIPKDRGSFFLRECFRILKTNGILRIVVPDLLLHAEKYVESTKKLLHHSLLPDDRSSHDKFLETIFGAYLKKKRYGAEHYYMYDLPTLVSLLRSVGFQDIKKFDFQKGDDDELPSYDSRPIDSLHLEARKLT
ncbi:methyltransferase domain-containing protein [uncultured Desulfosarcina sp.]|uniref:class I SAM-dependent methyltransferase n=1 Tax=uncultured Desulfosarcina sp. TaxID=218289 RepID=UPI0029C6FA6D|nr:methyltransferase domain-containing protein [uncultured Desulfosarcina sp.]